MQEDLTAILDGWADVSVGEFETFAIVRAIDPGGTERVAHAARADVAAVALVAQYDEEEAAREAAEQAALSITPPAPPIPVQPTAAEAVSASPVEVQETPSTGGDAPQEEPPPAAVVTEPSAPAYPGLMLQKDRENYLRGVITVRVTQIERNRLEARYDANAQARQRWGFTEYHNASDLGLPITDEVRAAYQEFLVADQWVRATKDHADALRAAAITVGLDLLEAMQTSIEEGWP